ncbi:hypothetical protein [Paenibacillus polymyxa]|uniref:hypothetical protein n=1 Tax=Paenibacillus polymyxa TaxID=1406 RepID=UPI00287F4CF4|nr:hypothetical protein [Paenibacillus polymyxa]
MTVEHLISELKKIKKEHGDKAEVWLYIGNDGSTNTFEFAYLDGALTIYAPQLNY